MNKQKWLTVSEATHLAQKMGLERTHKTIRSWARNGHVTAQKQTNQNGAIWVVERDSLNTKIKSEIEFRDQQRASKTLGTQYEQVRAGTNLSEPLRTSLDTFEPSSQQAEDKKIQFFQEKIESLKIEVKFNEQLTQEFKKQYLKSQENLHAQARYIGHLESEMLRLGGTPDQTFLKAPKPHSDASAAYESGSTAVAPEIAPGSRPHPNQTPLYGNDLDS